MRRLIAALLASVMLVGAADARVAIIAPKEAIGHSGSQNYLPEPNGAIRRDMRLVQEAINDMGGKGNYVVIPQALWKTEWARTGTIVWPNGTTETFDGLIFPSYPGSYNLVSTTAVYPAIRLDSLTRVYYNGGSDSAGVLVPHLYLLTNAAPLRLGTADYLSSATAAVRCSVGVAHAVVKSNPAFLQSIYMTEKPSVRWQLHTYVAGWELTDTAIPGGIRKLLQVGACAGSLVNGNPQWPDSMPFFSASNETTLVWDRLWANPTSYKATYRAKTMTFCDYYGAGISNDSLYDASAVVYRTSENEGELSVLRFALAHFDSLIGGRLFTNGPAVRSVVVAGAVGRGIRRWTGGIAPGDTTAFYGSLDSLASWNVPVTFAANVSSDSATTYARDIIKLKSVTSARFTPYSTIGVFDTSAASIGAGIGKTTNLRWVDPWGRNRRRVFVGDFNTWSDTSIATMAKRQIAACDSIFGRPTVRVMVPPYDDWSPGVWGETQPYISKTHSRLYADSMMYALNRGGFIGVLANGQSPECDMSVSSGAGYTNPRGYIGRQGWYRPKFNGTATSSAGIVSYAGATMDPFLVITHSGSSMGLGKTQNGVMSDSTTSWAYLNYTLDRANGQFFASRWLNNDDWKSYGTDYGSDFFSGAGGATNNVVIPMDDFQYGVRRGYALKLFCSDLSGNPANPARTGLHVIRSLQQSFTATNLAAGRTLVRLGYLDEVRP